MAETDVEEKQFSKGVEVLARWKDGIWYLANVQEVDEKSNRCQVVFEDGTVAWLFYKDLQSSLTQLDLQCMVCHDGTSKKPNEIVLCDQCEQGYHQKCHIPEIKADILHTTAEWFCRQCVFANSAKAGGAAKQGPDAEVMRTLKRSLPYDLKTLHWDNKHRSNKEDLYCYCGGPGDWSCKMLRCHRCDQWFHEACIQCLKHPLIAGDRFYVFICGVCNEGKEYIKRMKLRWIDLAHFALYWLSTTYRKKYHNPDDILDFIDDHWDTFNLGESTRSSKREAHEEIKDVLRTTPSRFKQSSHDQVVYCLKSRAPPQPPKYNDPLPPPGTDMDDEETDNVQQGRRGKKRRLVGSSTEDQPELKSNKTSKPAEQRMGERKPRGRQKETKPPQVKGGETPMFPSPSMFKYLYSSSPSTQESSSSVTCPSSSKSGASSDQKQPEINFVPDPVDKDEQDKTVLQTCENAASSPSDSKFQAQENDDQNDSAENKGNIEIKEDVHKDDEFLEIEAPPGSHIVGHVLEIEDPIAVEAEAAEPEIKNDSKHEEQIIPEDDRLQFEDFEDYMLISRVPKAKDSIESEEPGQPSNQESGDTETTSPAREGIVEKIELENQSAEESSAGQDNEFVLRIEESMTEGDDSMQEDREEREANVSTNGHATENVSVLGEDTDGVIEEKHNGMIVTDDSTNCVTKEKIAADVELTGEDGSLLLTCHGAEDKCSTKSHDQLVDTDVFSDIPVSQIIQGHDAEEDGAIPVEISTIVGSFESKPFTADIDEIIPLGFNMEEK